MGYSSSSGSSTENPYDRYINLEEGGGRQPDNFNLDTQFSNNQGNYQYVRYSNSGNNAGGNMSKFAGYFQSKSGNSGGNYNQRPGQAGDNGGGDLTAADFSAAGFKISEFTRHHNSAADR